MDMANEGAGGEAARLAKERKSEREKWYEIITLSNKVDEKLQVCRLSKSDLSSLVAHCD